MKETTEMKARLAPPRTPSHPAARALETVAFDDAAAHAGSPLAAHVDGCKRCRAVVDELRAQRADFLARRPADVFMSKLGPPEPRWRRRVQSWLRPGLILGAAVASVALLLVISSLPTEDPGRVRLRGEATFGLHVSRHGRPAAPHDGRALRPGDVLRFVVSSQGAGYAFVVNLDERGTINAYVPAEGAMSVRFEAGARRVLPGSIVLDDFVGQERIFLFVSEGPLKRADVFSALLAAHRNAGGRLSGIDRVAIGDAEVSSIAIVKGLEPTDRDGP